MLRGEQAPEVTARERECLRHAAAGMTNRAIGRKLHLSPAAVNLNLGTAYERLGAVSRAHAVALALRAGIIE